MRVEFSSSTSVASRTFTSSSTTSLSASYSSLRRISFPSSTFYSSSIMPCCFSMYTSSASRFSCVFFFFWRRVLPDRHLLVGRRLLLVRRILLVRRHLLCFLLPILLFLLVHRLLLVRVHLPLVRLFLIFLASSLETNLIVASPTGTSVIIITFWSPLGALLGPSWGTVGAYPFDMCKNEESRATAGRQGPAFGGSASGETLSKQVYLGRD